MQLIRPGQPLAALLLFAACSQHVAAPVEQGPDGGRSTAGAPSTPDGSAVRPTDAASPSTVRDDAARDAGARDAGNPSAAPPLDPGPVWREESVGFKLFTSDHFGGSYYLARTRAQLSSEQLALLSSLESIPRGPSCTTSDPTTYQLTITDRGGETRSYAASVPDGCHELEAPLLGSKPLSAMLETVHCLASARHDGSTLASASRIAVGDGCHRGLSADRFTGPHRRDAAAATPDWWLLIDVQSPGLHRISLDHCGDRDLHLELLDADGTVLASTDPSTDLCTTLEHDLPTAGTYSLFIEQLGGQDNADFYLSVDRVEL